MSAWSLFPFPTLLSDGDTGSTPKFEDGSIIATPAICSSCPTKECRLNTAARRTEIYECRFGMNYVRLDDCRLIVGVLAVRRMSASRKSKSLARRHRELWVYSKQLLVAAERAASLGPGVV